MATHTPGKLHLWLRAEHRGTERRTPLVPGDAAQLVGRGVRVTVEDTPKRIFPPEEYGRAGCDIVRAGTWVDAPDEAIILGIKELPEVPAELHHTHVYFAHAYKGQAGARELLSRFQRGGGEVLDLEYLTLEGRRVIAFGFWAGYVGASLGALQSTDALRTPVEPFERADLDAAVRAASPGSALVIGALGRSGSGAVDALTRAGAKVTAWDLAETRQLDKEALLDHELLVNCVVSHSPQTPFVTAADVDAQRRLSTIADVTCDVTSEHNLIPLNDAITTWEEPVRSFGGTPALEVIAIDNLPSLLPREASVAFSADLVPLIDDLPDRAGAWASAEAAYHQAVH